MSLFRSLFAGLAVLSTAIALGCVARVDAGDEPIGAAGDAVKWNGCPNDGPISTANYAPPHAFPGPCYGYGDPQQAEYDGALAEMWFECRQSCGQSIPECGRDAHIEDLTCIDRDIGHRWGAYCICGY